MISAYFTAVIPSHNCTEMLREAIQSILAPSSEDFELITVDDGSTDSSLDVVFQ